jgi:hypothetical protein
MCDPIHGCSHDGRSQSEFTCACSGRFGQSRREDLARRLQSASNFGKAAAIVLPMRPDPEIYSRRCTSIAGANHAAGRSGGQK